jgi:hypothetical protein
VSAATQIYYASFDAVFVTLPPILRVRIEHKIDEHAVLGSRWVDGQARAGSGRAIGTSRIKSAYGYKPIRTTDSKDQIGTAPVSATIESFTLSI